MKKRISRSAAALVLAAVFSCAAALGAGSAEWLTDFEEAQRAARDAGRPVLINFTGSDWCGWCVRLKNEVFSRAEFQRYAAANLVLLEIDFPRRIEVPEEVLEVRRALAREYGVRGYPTILLVDAEGEVLGRTGYRRGGASAYVEHLKELLSSDSGD